MVCWEMGYSIHTLSKCAESDTSGLLSTLKQQVKQYTPYQYEQVKDISDSGQF